MSQALQTRIRSHLHDAGYSDTVITAGIAYAVRTGFCGDDDALSIVIAHILYGEAECDRGTRFAVEAGSDW